MIRIYLILLQLNALFAVCPRDGVPPRRVVGTIEVVGNSEIQRLAEDGSATVRISIPFEQLLKQHVDSDAHPIKSNRNVAYSYNLSDFCFKCNPVHFSMFKNMEEKCVAGELPPLLCTAFQDGYCDASEQELSSLVLKELAEVIVDSGHLPIQSNDVNVNSHIAYGGLLTLFKRSKESLDYFNMIQEEYPTEAAVVFMKALAILWDKAIPKENVQTAIKLFHRCGSLDRMKWECHEKEAALLFGIQKYSEALKVIEQAIEISPLTRLLYLKGYIQFFAGDLIDAEESFRQCASRADYKKVQTNILLGMTLFERGKLRNAVEVFRDVIRMNKNHEQAHMQLARAYYELGNYPQALRTINNMLTFANSTVRVYQIQGLLYYNSGQPYLAVQSFEKCLSIQSDNQGCLYMFGLCKVAQGQMFPAIKSTTKAIVYSQHPALKASTHFIKAHYLREYARYLNTKLDQPFQEFDADADLCGDFKSYWIKNEPFSTTNPCMTQPNLQPDIPDVQSKLFADYSPEIQHLLCMAKRLGQTAEVNADGFLTNRRMILATGLGAVHIGQKLALIWKQMRTKMGKNVTSIDWKSLYKIAANYQHLVDPNEPMFWNSHMPDYYLSNSGFKTDINFIKGHSINIKTSPYFDLVFKLVRSMIDNYNGGGVVSSASFRQDIKNAKTYDQLINVVRQNKLKDQGFVISTQVPSLRHSDAERYDGVMILLSGTVEGRVDFAINHLFSQHRMDAYGQEIQFILDELFQHIKRKGVGRLEQENMVASILSLAYYMYNLMPLSHGSGIATYTVVLGLLLSVGREITGKVPPGKQLDLEAILSGAPDSFVAVTQQWHNIQRSEQPLLDLPFQWEVFPNVRHIFEVLNLGLFSC